MDNPALAGWQHWPLDLNQPPRILQRLSGGLTNQSYLIEACGQRFVLRRNAPNTLELGIDRQREKTILLAASAAGLAPRMVYCKPEDGVLISEYIAGRHLSPSALQDAKQAESLQELILRVHALKLDLSPRNYSHYIKVYRQQILAAGMALPGALMDSSDAIIERLEQQAPYTPVLCHHDLVPGNIMQSANGKLLLLDWEYAAVGWAEFDWASLANEWDLVLHNEQHRLLSESLAGDLYRHICQLWQVLQRASAPS